MVAGSDVGAIIINDGQHRRAAIEAALKERPNIGDETIAIVFFMDLGLARSQQMFADLNRYAIRPTKSLSVLFDHRDPLAAMARHIVREVDVFDGMTELAKTTISNRSTKLFTLSGIHRATVEFQKDRSDLTFDDQRLLAIEFWSAVATHIPEWGQVKQGAMSAAVIRKDYVHAHSIALAALGRAGGCLISERPRNWKQHLVQLELLDWRRSNTKQWEGRVTVGGQISASSANQTLLTNAIKSALQLNLTADEQAAEDVYLSERALTLEGGAHGRRHG